MNALENRIKRVVASQVEGFVMDKLAGSDTDRLREAKQRERQARMKALARAAAGDTASGPPSSGSTPQGIRRLKEEEDCPVCTQILDAISEMDEPKRTEGVAEYGEFRRAIEESEEAAIEVVEDAQVLPEAMSSLREVSL